MIFSPTLYILGQFPLFSISASVFSLVFLSILFWFGSLDQLGCWFMLFCSHIRPFHSHMHRCVFLNACTYSTYAHIHTYISLTLNMFGCHPYISAFNLVLLFVLFWFDSLDQLSCQFTLFCSHIFSFHLCMHRYVCLNACTYSTYTYIHTYISLTLNMFGCQPSYLHTHPYVAYIHSDKSIHLHIRQPNGQL